MVFLASPVASGCRSWFQGNGFGYAGGGTGAPAAVDAYSMSHIVGDVVVAATGAEQAVVVGHDWGAMVAWYSALIRPDVFRAVAALSVPYVPPIPALPEVIKVVNAHVRIVSRR
jgi:pimeloyl-ACP methyl ester carboxylesterase